MQKIAVAESASDGEMAEKLEAAAIRHGIGDHFTAEIQAYHRGKLLGTFTENGFSGDVGDNSNIFLGIRDKRADITSVIFNILPIGSQAEAVAINWMTIAPFARSVSPN